MRAFLWCTAALALVLAATTACEEQESGADLRTPVAGRTATSVATEAQPTAPSTTPGGVPTAELPVPTEGGFPTPELTPTTAATDGIVTIDIGQFTAYQTESPAVVVARDNRQWETLWSSHRGDGKAPSVDFNERQVIAVFLGPSGGGDTVEVMSVTPSQSDLVVHATYRTPRQGCLVPAVITYPFHIVSVPRMPGDGKLDLVTEVIACD